MSGSWQSEHVRRDPFGLVVNVGVGTGEWYFATCHCPACEEQRVFAGKAPDTLTQGQDASIGEDE